MPFSHPQPADQTHPEPTTQIHTARRRQLVDAAIQLIAEIGLPAASTVQIAMRAGVSRGMLTHHFTDRDDLLDAIVAEVYEVGRAFVGPAVQRADGPRAALCAFASRSVELYAAHPAHLTALREIFAERTRGAADGRAAEPLHSRELHDLATLLRAGQDLGELGAYDAATMAVVIRSVLDGALRRINEGADPERLRDEIAGAIDRLITMHRPDPAPPRVKGPGHEPQ